MQRQTISFLTRRFQEVGIRPDIRRGQNFLIDLNLVELLAATAELTRNDVVLEVGTGTGSLTGMLARAAAWVVTVEVDPQLYQLASEELADLRNITMLQQDALKNKNRLDPRLVEAVTSAMAAAPHRRLKLVANLPYNVATPIISNLLASDLVPARIVVTIQKELADRITASPSTKDYSALSIWIQAQCETQIVRLLPPSVFWPRPQVHSAILEIRPQPERRAAIPDLDFFHAFVRAMFFHRRKYLRSVIQNAYKEQLTKPDVDGLLAEIGIPGDCRAEQLDVPTMLRLCETVRPRVS